MKEIIKTKKHLLVKRFKIIKFLMQEGVTIDDVEFAKDEVLELDSDALNVADLLAEGSIVEVEPEEELAPDPEPVDEEEFTPASEATEKEEVA